MTLSGSLQSVDLQDLEQIVRTFLLGLPRFYVVFVIMPVLSKRYLGGAMVKNAVILSLALFLYPVNAGTIPVQLTTIDYFLILTKELVLGIVMGYIATIPFWVVEGVGFFVDNQRGASMASTINPMLGEQTSPLGIFFTQLLSTLFVVSGALLVLIATLVKSYTLWPVGVLYPEFFNGLDRLVLSQLDYIMRYVVLFSAPVIAAMFLAEFALGLISRFSPQLNVFFLAMPIKSGVAFFMLVVFLKYLVEHLLVFIEELPEQLLDVLAAPLVN